MMDDHPTPPLPSSSPTPTPPSSPPSPTPPLPSSSPTPTPPSSPPSPLPSSSPPPSSFSPSSSFPPLSSCHRHRRRHRTTFCPSGCCSASSSPLPCSVSSSSSTPSLSSCSPPPCRSWANVVSSRGPLSSSLPKSRCIIYTKTDVSSPDIPLPVPSPSFSFPSSVKSVIVFDTNALVRHQRPDLFNEPDASRRVALCIPSQVLAEVRDCRSRFHVEILTSLFSKSEMKILSPNLSDIQLVRNFAKLTGDLPVLSYTDIEVIALTYMLQRQTGNTEMLRSTPQVPLIKKPSPLIENWTWGPPRKSSISQKMAVKGMQRADDDDSSITKSEEETEEGREEEYEEEQKEKGEVVELDDKQRETKNNVVEGEDDEVVTRKDENTECVIDDNLSVRMSSLGLESNSSEEQEAVESSVVECEGSGYDEVEEEEEYEEDKDGRTVSWMDSGGGDGGLKIESGVGDWDEEEDGQGQWITAENFKAFQLGQDVLIDLDAESGIAPPVCSRASSETRVNTDDTSLSTSSFSEEEKTNSAAPEISCMTTDFAMQNVLLQMGLKVLSVNGMAIRTLRLWGLLCRGCWAFTRDSDRLFCSKCGHPTVDRVPFRVDSSTGKVHIFDIRKKINLRGSVYTLPTPVPGKREKPIILCEDQLFMCGRDRERRYQEKLWRREKEKRDPFNINVPYGQGWWKRTILPSGKLAVSAGPKIEIGLGKGNPNSNLWRKRRFAKK